MFSLSQRQRFVWFALLAILSYVLWNMNRQHTTSVVPQSFTKGYAATGVKGHVSNLQGDYVLRFIADELVQYDHSDQIDIVNPHFWTLDKNVDSWRLKADHGRYDRQRQRVVLEQQVKLENLNVTPGHAVQMTTNRLTLSPEIYEASTTAPVSLRGNALRAESVGAVFDLRNNRHRLLSQVRINYSDQADQPRQVSRQSKEHSRP